ncbi:MAG: hypothetical protein Q8R36_03800 [bacterium]|nr:hypothetical protein [bacterium]
MIQIKKRERTLYNNRVKLEFFDEEHKYLVNGNKRIGVTTLLGVLDKPALNYWKVTQALDYVRANRAALNEDPEKILKAARDAHKAESQKAADIGTITHDFVDSWIKTGGNIKLPDNENVRKAIEAWFKWIAENKVEFYESELPVYSLKHDYCGTIDFIARINGKMYIGDLKTTNTNKRTGTGIYPEYWLQTAGYWIADTEESGRNYDGRCIVRLDKQTGALEVGYNESNEKDAEAFLAVTKIYKFLNHD